MAKTRGTYQSGKNGVVILASGSVELEITSWTRDEEAQSDRFATSKTNGQLTSEPGNNGSTGTIEGKLVDEAGFDIRVLLAVGQKLTAKLGFTDARGLNQPLMIKKINFGVNVDSGEMQTFSMDWESTDAATAY